MPKYKVGITWTMFGHYTIEAANPAEALRIAKDEPLPEDGQFEDYQLLQPVELTETQDGADLSGVPVATTPEDAA